MSSNPILVTGTHRSGSTFVGKMLSLNSNVAYIQEPFNKGYGLKAFNTDFKYITEHNIDKKRLNLLSDLIELRGGSYSIPSIIEEHKGLENRIDLMEEFYKNFNISAIPEFVKRMFFKSRAQLLFIKAKYDPRVERVLLKDPLACLASQFLYRQYSMDVVVLVRHPLCFAESLKRLGWKFNFENFLSQQKLMDDYLEEFRQEMIYLNNKQSSVIEEACLIWNCIYTVLSAFIEKNPEFTVFTHEKIALHPLESFRKMYSRLKLNYSPAIEKTIISHTKADNSIKARDNRPHQLKRNSSEFIHKWRDALTADEISYIKRRTGKLAARFYDQDFFRKN